MTKRCFVTALPPSRNVMLTTKVLTRDLYCRQEYEKCMTLSFWDLQKQSMNKNARQGSMKHYPVPGFTPCCLHRSWIWAEQGHLRRCKLKLTVIGCTCQLLPPQ